MYSEPRLPLRPPLAQKEKIKIPPPAPKPGTCSRCGLNFVSQAALRLHVSICENASLDRKTSSRKFGDDPPKPQACFNCGLVLPSKGACERHRRLCVAGKIEQRVDAAEQSVWSESDAGMRTDPPTKRNNANANRTSWGAVRPQDR